VHCIPTLALSQLHLASPALAEAYVQNVAVVRRSAVPGKPGDYRIWCGVVPVSEAPPGLFPTTVDAAKVAAQLADGTTGVTAAGGGNGNGGGGGGGGKSNDRGDGSGVAASTEGAQGGSKSVTPLDATSTATSTVTRGSGLVTFVLAPSGDLYCHMEVRLPCCALAAAASPLPRPPASALRSGQRLPITVGARRHS
jgi:hypothetical protein